VLRAREYQGSSYLVFFSVPVAFTPVCTTELAALAKLEQEFALRNTKILGLGLDTVEQNVAWMEEVEKTQGVRISFPVVADASGAVGGLYGMV